MIALAVNLAVRDVLGFHEPIVVDSGLVRLEQYLLTSCFQALMDRTEQRVILQPESVFMFVSAKPNVNVVVNKGRRSEVKAASA